MYGPFLWSAELVGSFPLRDRTLLSMVAFEFHMQSYSERQKCMDRFCMHRFLNYLGYRFRYLLCCALGWMARVIAQRVRETVSTAVSVLTARLNACQQFQVF